MKNFAANLKMSSLFTILLLLFQTEQIHAQVISPSAMEVKYSYTATFEVPDSAIETTDQERAQMHASHIFGIFRSPAMTQKYSINSELVEGLGAPSYAMKIKILSSKISEHKIKITYSNSGKMILHKLAATRLLKKGYLNIPLPANPYEIFDPACTDEHYNTFGDFWYFYDPFRSGCEALSQPPLATRTRLNILPLEYKKTETKPNLDDLRGDNGNKSLFSMYIIHGYAEDKKASDEGRLSFKEFNIYLKSIGFTEAIYPQKSNPLRIYTQEITLDNGKKINVEIKHLLVDTLIESRSKAFAMFFKEAVQNADFIFYNGHSGLGGNLDIPSLEQKAGPFKFNQKKKQLFFFDSCSSYSYYLQHFAAEKTKSKIDILSNGLASYFYTSNKTLIRLLDHMLTPASENLTWLELLADLESVLDGKSYLLNVGGI